MEKIFQKLILELERQDPPFWKENKIDRPIILLDSGGADSSFLSHFLRHLDKNNFLAKGWSALHFQHGIRPDDHRDKDFCEEQSRKYKISLSCVQLKVKQNIEKRESLEMAGRRLRHEYMASLQKENPELLFVLAHHRDDLLETALMRIGEGSGAFGLIAMEYYRDNVWRPLLPIGKEEIYISLEKQSLPWIEDPSNNSNKFLRNRIRKMLPDLKNIFPRIENNFMTLRDNLLSLRELYTHLLEGKNNILYYQSLNKDELWISWNDFNHYPPNARRQLLHYFLQKTGISLLKNEEIQTIWRKTEESQKWEINISHNTGNTENRPLALSDFITRSYPVSTSLLLHKKYFEVVIEKRTYWQSRKSKAMPESITDRNESVKNDHENQKLPFIKIVKLPLETSGKNNRVNYPDRLCQKAQISEKKRDRLEFSLPKNYYPYLEIALPDNVNSIDHLKLFQNLRQELAIINPSYPNIQDLIFSSKDKDGNKRSRNIISYLKKNIIRPYRNDIPLLVFKRDIVAILYPLMPGYYRNITLSMEFPNIFPTKICIKILDHKKNSIYKKDCPSHDYL